MRLDALMSELNITVPEAFADQDIDAISYDSRMCAPGTLFVCIEGNVTDGHFYAKDAYERGVRAFLCQKPIDLPKDAAVLYVPNTRTALADVAAAFYGHPADKLRLIGITGTKGKTSTALFIYSILSEAGIPVGYIGTVGVMFCGRRTSTLRTTPESADIQLYLHKMVKAGVKIVIIEVSSQAIFMERIHGLKFESCIFTNLSPDHIGRYEHPNFEHYRASKARLFSDFGCEYIVYNADDENSTYMLAGATALSCGVSVGGNTHVRGEDIRLWRERGALGVDFTCVFGDRRYPIRLRTPGTFSVYNALEAITVAHHIGIPFDIIRTALSKTTPLGRFEVVDALPYCTFVIDYAHNAVSLEAALSVLREYNPARLIVLVGCVGGRTFSRRKPVGETISRLADFCILTADDPDFEDPMTIIRDILDGFGDRNTPFTAIPDRAEAVRYAVRNAREGDIILFAGKGHEAFQLIRGEYLSFSERSIITEEAIRLSEEKITVK